jgi:hypothetical protein
MVPILEESVQSALAEFYMELSCLLHDCNCVLPSHKQKGVPSHEQNGNVLHTVLTTGYMDINEILACCYQAARTNVRKQLHMLEVD